MAVPYVARNPSSVIKKTVETTFKGVLNSSTLRNGLTISRALGYAGVANLAYNTGVFLGEKIVESTSDYWLPYFTDGVPSPAIPISDSKVLDNSTTVPSVSLTIPKDLTKKKENLAKTSLLNSKTKKEVQTEVASGSLLDVLSKANTNTNLLEKQKNDILAVNLSLMNEQLSAHLLYQDLIVQGLGLIASSTAITAPLTDISEKMGVIAESLAISTATQLDLANENTMEKLKPIDYTSHYEKISAYSESAKVVSDYAQTETVVKDLDGVVVASARPMEIQTAKDATTARYRTDVNNTEFDDIDLPSFDSLPILPFVGVSASFDVSKELANPFLAKYLQ